MDTNYFTTKSSDRDEYVLFSEHAPEWLRGAVYKAHGDELPNDWRYMVSAKIWDTIIDMFGENASSIGEMAENMDRHSAERVFAEMTENWCVSTPSLFQWAAHGTRYALIADVEWECDRLSVAETIAHAYWTEIKKMTDIIAEAVMGRRVIFV